MQFLKLRCLISLSDKAMNVRPEGKGVVRALFDKGEGVDVNNIPSQHICPLKQEPPVIGVYFHILN